MANKEDALREGRQIMEENRKRQLRTETSESHLIGQFPVCLYQK